jgi:transposase-like protein
LIRREDQVMARRSPYPAEFRRRAVAMVAEVRNEHDTEFAAIRHWIKAAPAAVLTDCGSDAATRQ